MRTQKIIPYFLVIAPFVFLLVLSNFLLNFYTKNVNSYLNTAQKDFTKEYINLQKSQSKESVIQLTHLCESTNKNLLPLAKKELQTKVASAYKVATNIHEKNKKKQKKKVTQSQIKELLSQIVFNDENNSIFIRDYNGNTILNDSPLETGKGADYLDADYRSIVLEEIQKVRRHGEGYIESRRNDTHNKELIYVKNLGFYKWYIGSTLLLQKKKLELKKNSLKLIQNIAIKKQDFISLVEGKTKLYGSNDFVLPENEKKNGWHIDKKNSRYYFVHYFKEFNWYIIHGFSTAILQKKLEKQSQTIHIKLDEELAFMRKISIIIILFVLLLSILVALKIHKIFKVH